MLTLDAITCSQWYRKGWVLVALRCSCSADECLGRVSQTFRSSRAIERLQSSEEVSADRWEIDGAVKVRSQAAYSVTAGVTGGKSSTLQLSKSCSDHLKQPYGWYSSANGMRMVGYCFAYERIGST